MKTNVCILQYGLARGGTDTFVVNLCKGLDKSKFNITIINPAYNDFCRAREPEVLASGAKIMHITPPKGIVGRLRHLYELYRILKKEKFKVFQTNLDLFNGPELFMAWLAKVPLRCCHSHNSNQCIGLESGKFLLVSCYQMVMRWMCRTFSNRQCGCSAQAMEFLFPGLDWKGFDYPVIISNGIDLSLFQKKIDKEKKLSEIGLPHKKFILTVGHLINQKNPLFTARLFVKLCSKRDDVNLLWIGEGIMKEEVLDILRDGDALDQVHFLGYRNDVNEIMQLADVFILPSVFEGLGIVAIEAQASGLPSLLSDTLPGEVNCGGVKFLPIDKGEDCWVEAINKVLNKELSLKSDPVRLHEFSIERMAEQMSKVFCT